MGYTEKQSVLKTIFNLKSRDISQFPNRNITIENFCFESSFNLEISSTDNIFFDQCVLGNNNTKFTYPIIRPESPNARKNAIIMLHGLNERSWDKYLAWANTLAEQTGKSVILFPIAFHMNRSPEKWNNPHSMAPFVSERKVKNPDVQNLSFVNLALSERLTIQPQRFFLSGYQAANDLLQLMDEIKNGQHSLFDKGTSIDFFAYSIGVLLSQVLLVANPENRFDDSKFFFFCGGSVFEGMNGTSKFILDNKAFDCIVDFYCNPKSLESTKNGISDLIHRTSLGSAFRSLISIKELRKLPGSIYTRLIQQTKTISLRNDKVIPADRIKQTLRGADVEVWDFAYNYSHENPFPVFNNKLYELVDKAFESVFRQAAIYLA